MQQNNPDIWAQTAQQFQQTLAESWGKAMQSFQGLGGGVGTGVGAGLGGFGTGPSTAAAPLPQISFSPDKLQELQQQYLKDAVGLWTQGFQGKPIAGDKRFSADAWSSNPVAALTAATYLLNARTLMGLADAVEADAKTRSRIR